MNLPELSVRRHVLAYIALLPAALGFGAGSDSDTNGPLAVAIIGGMVSSTLLTLVVVPSVYSLVERGLERLARSPSLRTGENEAGT